MNSRRHRAQAFQDALSGRRVDDAEIRALVEHAEAMCAAAAGAGPSPAFTSSLRERLMSEAATVLVPAETPRTLVAPTSSPTVRTGGFRRRAARAAGALVLAGGGVGLVTSSASAVPGDMLYTVKRGVENVELALHRSDAAKGEYQLAQARERLAEATALVEKGAGPDAVADSLADVRSSATAGAGKLFDDFASEQDAGSVETVIRFVNDASSQLAALSAELPVTEGDPLSRTAATIEALAVQAQTLCGSCAAPEVSALVAAVPTPAPVPPADAPQAPAQPGPAEPVPAAEPAGSQQGETAPLPSPSSLLPTVAPAPSDGIPIVTPLLGSLLGSETQEGLIPGLLDGLLGGR